MEKTQLGVLKEIELRKVWEHEQYDFSDWLAQETNLAVLSDTLNLELLDPEKEKFVGDYRCDIVCKDRLTGKNVLIENQLEQSNHDHLGKIITYASWLDTSIVIWIVKEARSEHASAIEWLNNHSSDDIGFFLIEIHAYSIDDSKPAPYFKIIEQPNDFVKTVKELSSKTELTDTKKNIFEFWSEFNSVLKKHNSPFNKRKATTDHWYQVALGISQCCINIELVNSEHRIRINVNIQKDKGMYDFFLEHKSEIESALGYKLNWDKKNEKSSSSICTYIDGLDYDNKSNYQSLMDQIIAKTCKLKEVFSDLVNIYKKNKVAEQK